MEWKFYFRNVVQQYSIKIEGWPVHLVRFQNLSEVSSPYDSLKTLLNNWSSGITYWKELSEDELEELVREREGQVATGEIQEPPQRRPRSDRGKKRRHIVERQAEEEEDTSDEDGDQPHRRKRAKRAAAQKAEARMGRNAAGKLSGVNRGDPAGAEADDDDYDDDDD